MEQKWYLNSQISVFTPTDPARLVRTESVPCDINNPLRKPPRYSDLHISQTLPKTNKINKVRLGFLWVQACWVGALPDEEQEGRMFSNRTQWLDLGALPLLPSAPGLSPPSVWLVSRKVLGGIQPSVQSECARSLSDLERGHLAMGMNERVDGGTVGMGGEPERGSLVVQAPPSLL